MSANGELGLTSEATPVSEHRVYATRRFGVFPWGRVRWFCCYVISYRHKANENRQS